MLTVDSSSHARVFLGETSHPVTHCSSLSRPSHSLTTKEKASPARLAELREGLSVAWPFLALSQVCLPAESASSSFFTHRKSTPALGLASFFWRQVKGHFYGS